jgi:vitamin B12 transporter
MFISTLYSQELEKELQEVSIDKKITQNLDLNKYYLLTKAEISNKQAEDLGDLLKSIPGITLKNYGGIGGLKTISARGINGSHSGVYVDGILLQNQITGQLDLSNVQVENIEDLKFTYHNQDDKIHPVSSYFYSNNLFINTFENQFSDDTLQIRTAVKFGSFGQKEAYFSSKYSKNNVFVSLMYRRKQAEGNFPFIVNNYQHKINQIRVNNDFTEHHAGFSLGKTFKNISKIKFQNYFNKSDKGLPGAVILYNPTFNQRLYNQSISSSLNYFSIIKSKIATRIYINNRYEELTYIDSSFLNAQNLLKSNYFSNYLTTGMVVKIKLGSNFVYFGTENESSTLFFENNQYKRFVNRFIINSTLDVNKMKVDFLLGLQHVVDKTVLNDEPYLSLNPSLTLRSKKPMQFFGDAYLSMKRTMRMPTFSELYYNHFVNTNLLPEISNQLAIGSYYALNVFNQKLNFSYSLFVNALENKIVATPSKNLFVWSIQNVGNVLAYGSEVNLIYSFEIRSSLKIENNFNYTYQKVLNYNEASKIYRHQIAYMPKHTLNNSLTIDFQKLGFVFSSYFNSMRYALNENVKQNEIPSFTLFDLSLFYTHKIKQNTLRYSFSVKNITNNSYEYIRNFVMPGRNYLISLSYAFH